MATFSPDGSSVAFSWNGEREENWDIYVKLIGPGSPQQLTTDQGLDTSPAWSPDGRSIAFVRILPDRAALIIVPSRGGPERDVLEIRRAGISVIGQLLSWSPDSRFLAVAASPSDEKSTAITAVDVTSGKTSGLTTPPAGTTLDQLPSVSPDGRTLAFVRRSAGQTGQLWLQPLSGTFAPIGEPTRVGAEALFYHGVAWSRDGRDLIVSSGNTGNVGLWRIPVQNPGDMQRLSPASDEWRQPAVSMQQIRLAFTRTTWDENLWRLALEGPGRPAGPAVSLMGSTRLEMNAQFSPEGSRIVFESLRSGTQELWVADRDERNALQLTDFQTAVVAERRRGRRTASRSRSTCEPMAGDRTSMSSRHEAANPFESRPTRPTITCPAGRVTGCGSTSGPRAAAGTRSGRLRREAASRCR